MATETLSTPDHSPNKSKVLDEEFSRSDFCEEKSRGDENAVFDMTPSSTRKRHRRINSEDEGENIDKINRPCRKTSITDSVENGIISRSPEVARGSSKKKTHLSYSSDSENSGEEPLGVTPGFNVLKGRGEAVRGVKKNLHEAFGKIEAEDENASASDSDSENNATVHSTLEKRRRKSTRGNGTANAEKEKRKQALEELRKKRERQARGLSGKTSLDNDHDNEGSVSSKLCKNNLIDDTIEKDQGEAEEEEEDSGSDLDDFIVEDSQSQELPVFAKLELEEAYKRLVQMVLSSILDSDFLSLLQDKQDPYFEEAKDTIEKVIESKKNLVGSTTWDQFKKMLESCSVFESQAIEPLKVAVKCQACRRSPRNLTQHIMFFSADCNGVKELPLEMEFSVGCYCAERGSLYHDLHHHQSQLKQSCMEKINKVREAMGNQSDRNIVEFCTKDEEWVDVLFKTFKALLNKADEWAEDGKKRKQMKAYCASFN